MILRQSTCGLSFFNWFITKKICSLSIQFNSRFIDQQLDDLSILGGLK
jgi:hypothetical protein